MRGRLSAVQIKSGAVYKIPRGKIMATRNCPVKIATVERWLEITMDLIRSKRRTKEDIISIRLGHLGDTFL